MRFFVYLFLLFIIYSFIGYIIEMVYMSIDFKKITNRGFLCGPILPIYGLGAISMVYTLTKYKDDILVVFVLAAVICSILEYITSFILEKVFHNMWWDYYDYKFNLNGRVCLLNTVLFGIGGVLIICFANPYIDKFIKMFSYKTQFIIFVIMMILFVIDTIYSIIVAYNLRNRIIIVEELKNKKISKIPKVFNAMLKKRVAKFKLFPTRLLNAFPRINNGYKKEFKIMKLINRNKKK